MDRPILKFFNFNGSRMSSLQRIRSMKAVFEALDSDIISIQEIDIKNSVLVFSNAYHVLVNLDNEAKDAIGIVTLVKRTFKIKDFIIGGGGRFIGLHIGNFQHWNVYPKSGTNNKVWRETFFRETLFDYLSLWSNRTKYTLIAGDHNCTNRLIDSANNQNIHYQPGLVYLMDEFKLQDDFVSLHGGRVEFSRISHNSSTRIDFVLSNTKDLCLSMEYKKVQGLDHKVIYAEYSLIADRGGSEVPKERRFDNFIFPKILEKDVSFLGGAMEIINLVAAEKQNFDDITHAWSSLKDALKIWAKSRTRSIKSLRRCQLKILIQEYHIIIENFNRGLITFDSIKEWRKRMDQFYKEEIASKENENKIKVLRDHHYDIQKDQRKFKYSDSNQIQKISIGGTLYEGTEDIVTSVHRHMTEELTVHGNDDENGPVSEEESKFLAFISELTLSNKQIKELEKPIEAEEIDEIFIKCDPDSSPGEDGITYRILKCLWQLSSNFRDLYLEFCNFVKEKGDFGLASNCGIMVLKDKKGFSIDYNKKRKITKVNKDANLGLGKVWVRRFMSVLADLVIPKSQFLCRNDANIVDELRDLRNINLHLKNENGQELDGSILSIDFKNAFRSLSWRWILLVMRKFRIPESFIIWLKAMYADLGIALVINGWLSDKIPNKRGLLEGHASSMQIYCMATAPLLLALESKLKGIVTWDGIRHRNKSFADDLKVILAQPQEVITVDKIITEFEAVSGLILHRDISRRKCNVLTFGSHRNYSSWPAWVNKVSRVKIIGAIFSNEDNIAMLNSKEVERCTLARIYGSASVRGTLLQKVYFLNTFIFSKLTYLAQVFILDEEVIKNITRKAHNFLYRGEYERPVAAVNFRSKEFLGLGLVHLPTKCKSLIMRTMFKEFLKKKIILINGDFSEFIYGHKGDLLELLKSYQELPSAKELYQCFLKGVIFRGDNLLPSRMEKKYLGTVWTKAYKNYKEIKFLNPKEKEFYFRFVHDLLHLGARKHVKGADKTCRRHDLGLKCNDLETRSHFFMQCPPVHNIYWIFKEILQKFIRKKVSDEQILTVSFRCKDRIRNIIGVWFLNKVLFLILQEENEETSFILDKILNFIDWIVTFCGGKYMETFHELRTEIEIQKIGFMLDI